jgi:tRNA pseudouridine38-40 synthase
MRIALGIEYNGHGFYGWQMQANLPTIQGHLEAALSKIAAEPITVFCAGRTDAGVHATGQVAHFNTEVVRHLGAWVRGPNTYLPPSIAVCWAKIVDEAFHARYTAMSRHYRYIIYNYPTRPAILAARVTWYYDVLNIATMQQAGRYLLGEHDFSTFRSAHCEAKTPMRNVQALVVTRNEDYIVIEIIANAFLHHMVRNIVGSLLAIGAGFKEPEWMQELLLAKDRRKAAATAPAEGLYLHKVYYPSTYHFPERKNQYIV